MRQEWFDEARFGMFVHFGAYSVAARHEWVQNYERLTDEEYRPYVDHFAPDRFDARAIARRAKETGMGYVVLTAKHHDGFCLFDSALTDFTSAVVCDRDLVREHVEALREEGVKVGLYYSLLDWHHPDFTVDWNHPRCDDENAAALNEDRDMARYREYLHGQVRELLTGYGELDYLFFDFSYPETRDGWAGKGPEDWDAEALLAMCRELQPGMLVNDRLGIPADFVTPEQYQPTSPLVDGAGEPQVWEACQTLNGSWGYHRDNTDQKSADLLVRMLADSVSMDGNMLLNIGPDGRGAVAPRDAQTLGEIGEWMLLHRDAIVGAGHAEFVPPREGVYTRRGDRLYLHLFTWPLGFVHLPDLAGRVSFARLLNDGSWLKTSVVDPDQRPENMTPAGQAEGTLTVHLPVRRPDVLLPVIELTLA
ncbi:alpha-L-fucosidase [Microbacterium esteraromaticum]|uniref:alpha-L-fucosidase n=1 Tax=Microbacterium esteraromaticum TaxID=57043 RepID=UPI001958CDF9|nr:alpha-L-fucosidase [Microbacterium esteraromaticum]MBM7467362.1 alpha-L-fucosidase [Microbacterium esteraromaticum]